MFKRIVKYHVPSANNENGKFTHVILNEPTDARTMASGILLANYYRKLEIEYYSKKYNVDIFTPEYKNISNWKLLQLLRKVAQRKFLERTNLICEYCKTPVILSIEGKKRNDKTATVDHFIPLKHFCDPFDESNFRVCCKKCNGDKGELSYSEWMEKKNG